MTYGAHKLYLCPQFAGQHHSLKTLYNRLHELHEARAQQLFEYITMHMLQLYQIKVLPSDAILYSTNKQILMIILAENIPCLMTLWLMNSEIITQSLPIYILLVVHSSLSTFGLEEQFSSKRIDKLTDVSPRMFCPKITPVSNIMAVPVNTILQTLLGAIVKGGRPCNCVCQSVCQKVSHESLDRLYRNFFFFGYRNSK